MERRAGYQGMIMRNACDYSLIFLCVGGDLRGILGVGGAFLNADNPGLIVPGLLRIQENVLKNLKNCALYTKTELKDASDCR